MLSASLHAQQPNNFSYAKKQASIIFTSHPVTLYCHCSFNAQHQIDLTSCNMQSAANHARALRVEWEHMMPAENFGQHFLCWRKPICMKKSGKKYRGRRCCEKTSSAFRRAEGELYNLWPAVGLVNQARSNYRYGIVNGPFRFYGCSIRFSKVLRRAEPPDYAKGTVARANLFMSDYYHIRLSDAQSQLFNAWNITFPADAWEKDWALKVKAIESYANPYIK